MVAEGDIEEEEQEEEADMLEDNPHQDKALSPHSPGALSQMSGTTAITTITTRSEAAIADLDESIEEDLPELYSHALNIVKVLTPPDVSKITVMQIVDQLKQVDSRLAKQLQKKEQVFDIFYDRFLSKGESYIRTDDIVRKFIGKEYGDGDFRPDAILHLANLATMIKRLLATDKGSRSMKDLQFFLDRWFPEAFARDFSGTLLYGNSTLLDESFDLALAIRTQFAISELRHGTDSDHWDPDLIITETFYANSEEPKSIMGFNAQNTPEEVDSITDRVEQIRTAVRDHEQAQQQGDLVDFEQLDELFPWDEFLTDLVSWARLRTDEIVASVQEQGGAVGIKEALSEAMKISGSQHNTTQTAEPDQLVQPSATVDITGELPSKE
jgi:hypothetical protein